MCATAPMHMLPRLQTPKARYERQRRIERRQFVKEYLAAHPCVCGESDPNVLDFHHVRGEKKLALGRMITAGYGEATIKKEIEKCEVLCANCHRKETAKQQGWSMWKIDQQEE